MLLSKVYPHFVENSVGHVYEAPFVAKMLKTQFLEISSNKRADCCKSKAKHIFKTSNTYLKNILLKNSLKKFS